MSFRSDLSSAWGFRGLQKRFHVIGRHISGIQEVCGVSSKSFWGYPLFGGLREVSRGFHRDLKVDFMRLQES